MKKKIFAIVALIIWIYIISMIMVLARTMNLEIFFVLVLIGLLVILELSDSAFVSPPHILKMKYIAAIGVVIFFIIVVRKVLEIING